jgi:hypothetical protein
MTDREVLELAAKAAGFGDPQICWTESEYPPKSGKQGALWNYVGHMDTAELWNPLTDDGDALRLAVQLGLFIQINSGSATAWKWRGENWYEQASDNADDMSATTRRAITRAAAEIGRNMK